NDITGAEWTDWCLAQWKVEGTDKEYLLEALEHGIPHNVLNAKYHEREALIIAEAGRKGQVTIATNMAGRGVDILLGGRVEDELGKLARSHVDVDHDGEDEYGETYTTHRRGVKESDTTALPMDGQERLPVAE